MRLLKWCTYRFANERQLFDNLRDDAQSYERVISNKIDEIISSSKNYTLNCTTNACYNCIGCSSNSDTIDSKMSLRKQKKQARNM